jgi:hypothetical protein
MIRPNRLFVAGAVAAAVLAGGSPARAEPYRDATHHFTVELPDDWQVMPAAELAVANATARAARGGDVTHVAGFRPKSGGPGAFPYVLVQKLPAKNPGMTFDDFERVFAADLGLAAPALVTGSRMEKPAFDRDRNRFTVQGRGVADGDPVGVYSAGYLGKEADFVLHAYAEEPAFAGQLPTFTALADSFRFDEPVASGPLALLDRLNKLDPRERMAVIGGGTVVVVLAVGMLTTRRRKSARPKQPWE